MNAFWAALARYAVKVAIYAAGHPDQVKAVVDDVVAVTNVAKSATK